MSRLNEVDHTAIVRASSIGPRAQVGAFTQVQSGAEVRNGARIGRYCAIESGATICENATIQDYVEVPGGVTVEERCVIGPHVTFADIDSAQSAGRTLIGQGAWIGAGAVLSRGITVGRWARVAPGSVVVQDVPEYAHIAGPAGHQDGWVCACGKALNLPAQGDKHVTCSCGRSYRLLDDQLSKYTRIGEGEG
jgi:UDP-2-acetamido-3-amino-2,3-dideoxy-glucuronate N-acetyltransferase